MGALQVTAVYDQTTVGYVFKYQDESGLTVEPYVDDFMWKFIGVDNGCI